MEIARIEFPEPLLTALRDGKLVVFAGAGVSMGEPANLPDFACLAQIIAEGTGKTLEKGESEDRFLGRLQHSGVSVHELAARALTRDKSSPTALHKDLLRLYSDVRQVRIVTTNFDPLFEQAADDEFGSRPEVFQAPALPLGWNFSGIVHVHGAVSHPDGMVLTERDFGRGYLIEGRTRQFLVDLFCHFTVLFVGYSHGDTIMNYLACALSESEANKRFVLTDKDASERWRMLGIKPIEYSKSDENDHTALDKGIRGLANMVRRSILDWQREVTELAKKLPPLDEEEISIIEYALKDATTTHFFTNAARSSEWIDWLDKRKHLEGLFLFRADSLSKRDAELAWWLTEHFTFQFADKLFLLISKHGGHLHPVFWHMLCRKINSEPEQDLPDKNILSRWVSVLLATVPEAVDPYELLEMGKRCSEHEMLESLLQIFDVMAGNRLQLEPGFPWPDKEEENPSQRIEANLPLVGDHYTLNELWEKGLKPNVAEVAEPMLRRVVVRLEEQYFTLRSWQQSNRKWDVSSLKRSAIEPHEQDEHPETIDVLIDVARDCLAWLAANQAERAVCWCDQIVDSDAPLLRRLAVHTLSQCANLTPNDKIEWLLAHVGLHDQSTHHEIFRAVALAYPDANSEHREKIIAAVLAYRWPNEEDSDKDSRTARHHFDWLHWIHRAAPDCALTKQALDNILTQYPQFEPEDHPDSLIYWGNADWVDPQSPWSATELLAKPAVDWLPELLSFQPAEPLVPDRNELALTVTEAAKQRFEWGLDLAHALVREKKWDADIWSGLIRAWSEMELDEGEHREVFRQLAHTELYSKHEHAIANALRALVKNNNKPYAPNLLPQANEIAITLWRKLEPGESYEESGSWLQQAINHPAGVLAEFWLWSLSLWRRQQDPPPKTFSDDYRQAFSDIVQDSTLHGRLGRSVLAGQLAFLLAADEAWAKENLLPQFGADTPVADFQAAWDGFLIGGRLTPAVAESLKEPFLQAMQRIERDLDLADRQRRFIGRYTAMLGYFVSDPVETWIPELFSHGGEKAGYFFALSIGNCLRNMNETNQREWWQRWLKTYWENRINGVPPPPLEPREVEFMLDWLPHLTAVFPEAVDLAIQMPKLPLKRCSVIYKLEKSELSQHHPKEVAKLLIHLGKLESPSYMWHKGRELVDKLLQMSLPSELEKELKELVIKKNLRTVAMAD